jgi:hypothetical protein
MSEKLTQAVTSMKPSNPENPGLRLQAGPLGQGNY